MPMMVEAFIAIMEIDLLQEFEMLMGCPLIPNSFWSVHILLACDIQAKSKWLKASARPWTPYAEVNRKVQRGSTFWSKSLKICWLILMPDHRTQGRL